MYYREVGFPEEGELVFGTVTNVQYNSVFVEIEEYGRSGLIHISEISTGRIRNINDYVKEGDHIICKVIKINEDKGHIDLSLRRVTELQKKNKRNQRKQEQKAEKLLRDLGKEIGEYPKKIYQDIKPSLTYRFLHEAFNAVVERDEKLVDMGIPKKYAEPLEEIVRDKIERKTVRVGGEISVSTYASDGLSIVKDALKDAESKAENVEINYLGAGKYKISVKDYNYKDAEETLEESLDAIKQPVQASEGGHFEFEKKKQKT